MNELVFEDLRERAAGIKNAVQAKSVSAEMVGGLIEDLVNAIEKMYLTRVTLDKMPPTSTPTEKCVMVDETGEMAYIGVNEKWFALPVTRFRVDKVVEDTLVLEETNVEENTLTLDYGNSENGVLDLNVV